eukprot:g33145.t1
MEGPALRFEPAKSRDGNSLKLELILLPSWSHSASSSRIFGSTSTFGAPFYGDRVLGRLVYGVPKKEHHCTEGDYDIPDAEEYTPAGKTRKEVRLINIVLVERGTCSFVTKVKVAQKKKAHAVIIVDNEGSQKTSKEIQHIIVADDGYGANIDIPSVLISRKEGQKLIDPLRQDPGTQLMPGAQPSANPAAREEFEQRCRQLHRDEEQERLEREYEKSMTAAAKEQASINELQAMFPTLDADLIRIIHAEAPTPQQAVETLLALAADAAPEGQAPVATPPPLDVGMNDEEKFPVLTDANGWQVVSQRLIDPCRQAVQHIPAPTLPEKVEKTPKKKPKKDEKEATKEVEEDDIFETDYDFRHRIGQNRAKHRARYGRGRGTASRSSGVEEEEDDASVADSSSTGYA